MIRAPRRLGFALSLLVHLGLAGGVWLWWQQVPSEPAVPGEVVPVQLAMFAEAPPAPLPTAAPAPAPEPPPEPVKPPPEPVEPPPEPVEPPPPAPEPRPKPKPVSKPAPAAARPEPHPPVPPKPAVKRVLVPPEPSPEPPAPPPTAAPAAAPRSAEQVALREAYKAELLAAIERYKFYPNRARRRRIEGEVRVGFRIASDGRLGDIRLVAGSGTGVLDEAALATLRRLARVAPLPPALGLDDWALVVPIAFELR